MGFGVDYFDQQLASTGALKNQLNEANFATKAQALNRVIAVCFSSLSLYVKQLSSVGQQFNAVFPDIVRQLFTPDTQVKRLAHVCLSLHGDENPDVVLLCVNALHKDLVDVNPLHRGVAIRTICGMKVSEVSEHALNALRKGSVDSSVYVRKSAAVAISKYMTTSIDFEVNDLLPILDRLLSDYEPSVVSAAVASLWNLIQVTGGGLEFLHPHFRRQVSVLGSLDYVGQYAALRVLQMYSLNFFAPHSTSKDFSSFLSAVEELVHFSSEYEGLCSHCLHL